MGPVGGAAPSQLRVSDAERHGVADLLARHFADGRLDQAELDERVGQAMRAKTRGDLAVLLADLPPLDGSPETATPVVAAPAAPRRHPLARAVGAAVVVLVALSWLPQLLFWHGWLSWHGWLWPGGVGRGRVPVLLAAVVALALVRRGRRRRRGHVAPGRPEGPLH